MTVRPICILGKIKNYWSYNKQLQDTACGIAHTVSRSAIATLRRRASWIWEENTIFIVWGRIGAVPYFFQIALRWWRDVSELPACLSALFLNVYLKTISLATNIKSPMHLNTRRSYSIMCFSALKDLTNTVQNWQLGNACRMTDCHQGDTGWAMPVFLVRMSLSRAQGS